jgi:hypothetical protein
MKEVGDILCMRVTGERVVVLNPDVNGDGDGYIVLVRRPTIGENGITWHEQNYYDFELETAEQHLEREAEEMYLKAKLQNKMQEKLEREESEGRKARAEKLLVN